MKSPDHLHSIHQKRASEPYWRVHKQIPFGCIPTEMLGWLLDPASLTKRLQAACSGQFSVQVLNQGWARPMLNESLALGVRRWNVGWVRQVKLLCDNQPWVFARTVIPRRTLTGKQRHLAHLGNKPLGAVLFSDRNMKRGEVEIASIVPGQQLFDLATSDLKKKPEKIWGRRSVFYLSGKPLLVSEIFLPTIWNRSNNCGQRLMRAGREGSTK